MCSQNAENVISEPQILKIFRGAYPGPPPSLRVTKYEPPRQKQNFTPMTIKIAKILRRMEKVHIYP